MRSQNTSPYSFSISIYENIWRKETGRMSNRLLQWNKFNTGRDSQEFLQVDIAQFMNSSSFVLLWQSLTFPVLGNETNFTFFLLLAPVNKYLLISMVIKFSFLLILKYQNMARFPVSFVECCLVSTWNFKYFWYVTVSLQIPELEI